MSQNTQRLTFVESLYKGLKKNAESLKADQQKFASRAREYLADGFSESECVELLMIDGLTRESAANYLTMVANGEADIPDKNLKEFSFRFEDEMGKVWSSYDVGMTVYASGEEDAWAKAESAIEQNDEFEGDRVLSVTPV